MTDTAVLDARTSPAVARLAERAALAHATVSFAAGWVDALRLDMEGRALDPVAHHAPRIEAFCRAWMALVKAENPDAVIEAALDGFVEDVGWPSDLATKARAMLLEGVIQPVIEGLRAKLEFADCRLDGLQAHLEVLRLADEADGGTSGPATLAALESVRQALQDAAGQGTTGANLQSVLDVWANATGGPRVTVHPLPASA